jgi:Tol biopolymer transport system component
MDKVELRMGARSRTIQALKSRMASVDAQRMRVTSLTKTGDISLSVISPDGKYLAYVRDEGDKESLWLKQLKTNSDLLIIPASIGGYKCLLFSPDNSYIYYSKNELLAPNRVTVVLYRIPVLGGSPKSIASNLEDLFTLSPDGMRLAFFRLNPDKKQFSLTVARTDRKEEKELSTYDFSLAPIDLAWSPDGEVIAISTFQYTNELYMQILGIRLKEPLKPEPLSSKRWSLIYGFQWLSDMSGLVLTAKDETSSGGQVWQLYYSSGRVQKITHDPNDYDLMSITKDGKSLVVRQRNSYSNIWVANSKDISQAKQITSGFGKYTAIEWTPNGKIVFKSPAIYHNAIWIMNPDGTNQYQLTEDTYNSVQPTVSVDGRYIFFSCDKDKPGMFRIWRMDIDGSNLIPLTKGTQGPEYSPVCSPDGKWLVYQTFDAKPKLWKVSINGGDPKEIINRQITSVQIEDHVFSPDGKSIAFIYAEELPDHSKQWKIAINTFDSNEESKTNQILDIPKDISFGSLLWVSNENAFNFVVGKHGVANIVSQPVGGDSTKAITNFDSLLIFSYAWSRDGKQLAYSRGVRTKDSIMLSDFR